MNKIFGYVIDYFRSADAFRFFVCTLFIAVGIYCNYHFGINDYINTLSQPRQYTAWLAIFLTAFLFGHLVQYKAHPKLFQNPIWLLMLFLAPAIFAWKMAAHFNFGFTTDVLANDYWNRVVYWPLKLLFVVAALFGVWKLCDRQQPFYGLSTTRFEIKPYFFLLVLMLPLLAWASTQPDFLAVYPKMKRVFFLADAKWYYKLLYELSYGSDFFTIELFFRGFLVLAFAKWVGPNAVLPMALFYCTIHFGKPLGECISSYFGGLILGAITVHTRSIWGGLMVHLGIAWLMEGFGYLGHIYNQ